MVQSYLEAASSLSNLAHRMEVLAKLCTIAPGAEFYASDLSLSGQDMNALYKNDIVRAVRIGREEFICIDEVENLYKKVYVKCWVVRNPNLRKDFLDFCEQMTAIFSEQMLTLSRTNP